MGIETRRNGKFYYRKRRVGHRVVSEYIGGGVVAELCAGLDTHERQETQAQRNAWRATVDAEAAGDRQLADYRHQVLATVATVLQYAGYHRHHRGEWRKKRGMAEQTQWITVEMSDLSVLARSVHRIQLAALGGVSKLVQQSILNDVATVRANLGWPSAPAHERLLIEHIGLCWLQLQLVEQFYAQNTAGPNYNQRTAEHIERRLSMAHHRYLQALETLARIRKLGINIQVNIGDKQVITG